MNTDTKPCRIDARDKLLNKLMRTYHKVQTPIKASPLELTEEAKQAISSYCHKQVIEELEYLLDTRYKLPNTDPARYSDMGDFLLERIKELKDVT